MGRLLAICRDAATTATLRADLEAAGHECEVCGGHVEAIRRLRARAFDVVLTDPGTSLHEDLALAGELRQVRPGTRVIVLAPAASHEDLIGAIRAQVFACFTQPFDWSEILFLTKRALTEPDSQHGIEVISGLPYWITLRVSCHLLTAERLVRFMTELERTLPESERELLMTAFREMLLNAMEHGAGFDREKVVEVTAARTERAIVYHFRDPGSGFDRADLHHAVQSPAPESVMAGLERREEMGLRSGGFGMLIVRSIVDEVVYNERGNEVLLIKHLT